MKTVDPKSFLRAARVRKERAGAAGEPVQDGEGRQETNAEHGRFRFSGRGLAVYAGTLLLCLLPPLVMNDLFGYFVPVFVLLISLLSAGICRWQSGHIRLSFSGGSTVVSRRDSQIFAVFLENTSWMPCSGCSITLRTEADDGQVLSRSEAVFTLGPREKRQFRFDVKFEHVGIYKLIVEDIRVQSLLGVLSVKADMDTSAEEVTVCPGAYFLEDWELEDKVYSESQKADVKSEAESIDCADVREYTYGDPIKLIHWKLSSHSGTYITRVLESYGTHAMTVIPGHWIAAGTEEHRLDLRDAVMESTASVCRQAAEDGIETRIRFCGKDGQIEEYLPAMEEDFSGLLREMAPFTADAGECGNVAAVIENEALSLYASDHVAICSAALGPEITDAIIQLTAGGRNVVLYYCTTGQDDRMVEKQLRNLEDSGIICWPFDDSGQLGKAAGL